jgi:hypothetical protein
VIPRDAELDTAGTSFSPGVRRLMSRLGGKEAFDEAREDLEALAGIVVQTKQACLPLAHGSSSLRQRRGPASPE